MNRTELDRRLAELKEAVTGMGQQVDAAILQSMSAQETADRSTASGVSCQVDRIHQERRRIEDLTALVIALHQPTLGDLRSALAAMNSAQDLEQIGNLAKSISRLATSLPGSPPLEETLRQALSSLAAAARGQVQAALGAYRMTSVPEALAVWARDDEVEHLYAAFVTSCRGALREHPEQATTNIPLLGIAQYLEEILDLAASICERVIYVATGQQYSPVAGAMTRVEEPKRYAPVSRGSQPLAVDRREKAQRSASALGGLWQQPAALQRFGTTLHGAARSLTQAVRTMGARRDNAGSFEPRS